MGYDYICYISCVTRIWNGDNGKKKVNVKKEYDWGIGREKLVIQHIGDEGGKGFEKLGKFDNCDYIG